jgi:hypothetical protein
MNDVSYKEFLKNLLTEDERKALTQANLKSVNRLVNLKMFFTNPTIFKKVSVVTEPMWLVDTIYNTGYGYEF